MSLRILLIDGDPQDRGLVARVLTSSFGGGEVVAIAGAEQLAATPDTDCFDVIVADHRLRWMDGVRVLRAVKHGDRDCPVVVFSTSGDAPSTEAIDSQAAHYVVDGQPHLPELVAAVRRAAARRPAHGGSAGRLAGLLEATPDVVASVDPDGRLRYVNPAGRRLLGLGEVAEPSDRSFQDLLPESERARFQAEALPVAVRDGRWSGESALLAADGTRIAVSLLIVAHRRPDGVLDFIATSCRDISERAKLEAQLRESAALFRSLLESAGDWVWEVDSAGVFTYCGPRSRDVLGWEPEDLVGRSLFDAMPDKEARRFRKLFRSMARRERGFSGQERVATAKDGNEVALESSATPLYEATGRLIGYRGVERDVTERRRLQQQLVRSQKMEEVGRLAVGVAHDFNNTLNVIIGYGEMLLRQVASDPKARSRVEKIRQAADRAVILTRQLLMFSHRRPGRSELLDLNAVLEDLHRMIERLVGEHVVVELAKASELRLVRADRSHIEQVIIHLAANARDAMPQGGRLRIATADVANEDDHLRHGVGVVPGPYVRIDVSDSGVGMSEEIRSRAFEPFFTTKAEGMGTGLGLSTVRTIVSQCGGHIRVESEAERGTRFEIYLPAEDRNRPEESLRRTAAPLRGSETVLLVEDQQLALDMMGEVLESYGYKVIAARGGDEALAAASAHAGPIDLLLTDVVMPGLSGVEVAERLSKERPGLRVVLMSGYADDLLSVPLGDLLEHSPILDKPFTPETLAFKVRQALDGPRAAER